MRYSFVTCDVFTDRRFGGNPLAVLPEADGLTSEQMQRITREFNYSETTFVLPALRGHDRRVRIFTPSREVPFAGHPNVGTAFALASIGALGQRSLPRTVVFEQAAGLVQVTIESREIGHLWCELTAPAPFTQSRRVPVDAVAGALGLIEGDIVTEVHQPVVASVGLPFLIVQVRDLAALARVRADAGRLAALRADGLDVIDVHCYVLLADPTSREGLAGQAPISVDIRARMFAPLDGVDEDPATGSANAALAGLLADLDPAADGEFTWRIAQGVEMGRPSLLAARVRKRAGQVTEVRIGGGSVMVMTGELEV